MADTETTERASQFMMASLMRDAVTLISVEEWCLCPCCYVQSLLELDDREAWPIADVLIDFLVQNGLVVLHEDMGDMWGNRDGSYWFAGEIGVPSQYVSLTEKGKAWAEEIRLAGPDFVFTWQGESGGSMAS